MRLAFYAPMKPPDDPVPSGDRSIARSLVAALSHGGVTVDLASRFRSRDSDGDAVVQQQRMAAAELEVEELVDTGRDAGWQAWITYHNYYKAPDLIGPGVSQKLGIPYLQVESTRARKRLDGPWAAYAQRAEAATDAAQVVFFLSERDGETLHRDAPAGQHLVHLRPFLPEFSLPATSACAGPMLSVGMMREGDKLASYRIIAETLARLGDTRWQLDIAGDGPARAEVEALMAPFGTRVRYHGAVTGDALSSLYASASLLFWPGVNEALGMVFLEAQAAGLPVVAQNRPGMREVLAPGPYPETADGPEGLARMLATYLSDDSTRKAQGRAARQHVEAHHLLPAATRTLLQGLALAGVQP